MSGISKELLANASWCDHHEALINVITSGFKTALDVIAKGLEQPNCLQVLEAAERKYARHISWGAELGPTASALCVAIRRANPQTVLPLTFASPPPQTPPSTALTLPAAIVNWAKVITYAQLEQSLAYAESRPEGFSLLGSYLHQRSIDWRDRPLAEVFSDYCADCPRHKAQKVLQALVELGSAAASTTGQTAYHSSTSIFG
jgi:hypothetical protein